MPTPIPGNPLNKETANPSKPHSNFDLSKPFGLTPRFGVNTPFFSMEVVTDDGEISITPRCTSRSFTLKAPAFGKVQKHIAFYQVPLQCILPKNWEKIVVNSQHGSDVQGESSGTNLVPALNGVNCVVSNFSTRLLDAFNVDYTNFSADLRTYVSNNNLPSYVNAILQFIIRWEMFFSHGNLLSHLGIHYGHLLKFEDSTKPDISYSFDGFCQLLLSSLENIKFTLVDADGENSVRGYGSKHIRKVMDFCRSKSLPSAVTSATVVSGSFVPVDMSKISYSKVVMSTESEPLNLGRLYAYQIVNAHYYTNDKIDYVYTADLYRQYIGSLLYRMTDVNVVYPYYFEYNGITCQYDELSGYFFNNVLDVIQENEYSYSDSDYWTHVYPYLNAIFGFNYSLRYIDYFVGARPRNLAISGPNTPTNVQVANNSVDVINITKSLVAQRFLNAVARVPQNIEDYSEKILGRKTEYDWHNPKYLFSYDMDLFTSEVENTGEGQLSDPNSVTSVLRGSCGDLRFEIHGVDRYSFIVGIENFDFKRFYFSTQDKNTMAIDRFDMFVPELQYTGDQALKLSELVAGSDPSYNFGYQLKDMQFKQTFPECCGGFVENLPGWLFTFNPLDFDSRQLMDMNISPDFIRSKPTEIDDFYLSLTGLTLASYFHFIELWDIEVSANRPMIAAPNIL